MDALQREHKAWTGPLRPLLRRLEMWFFRSRASWIFSIVMSRRARHLYEGFCRELGELPPGTRLADIGCGHGTLLAMCLARNPGVVGFGLDQSAELVRFAERQCRRAGVEAEFMVADVHEATLPARAFDAIASTSSIYCWRDPVRALNNLYESLKPGGRFLLWEVLPIDNLADARRSLFEYRYFGLSLPAYTESELRRFVAQSRFTITDVRIDRLIIRFDLTRPPAMPDPT